MRKHYSVLIAMAAILTACNSSADSTKPGKFGEQEAKDYATATIATTPYGKPFELNGCTVQVYKAFGTPPPGYSGRDNFTMATAACPTASVTTARESCGKNCVDNTLKVQAGSPLRARDEAMERKKTELNEKLRQLQAAQADVAGQLKGMDGTTSH